PRLPPMPGAVAPGAPPALLPPPPARRGRSPRRPAPAGRWPPGSDPAAPSRAVIPLEDERGVVSAEAERVAHGGADRDLARDVGDVVQVALRIGILVVDGRRQHAVLDGLDAGDRLDPATRPQQVAGH